MKTKYLKRYILCIDAFGDMPLWSLQHPKTGARDSYMLKVIEYDSIFKQDDYLINELDRLAKIDRMWFNVYITCKIHYAPLETEGQIIKDYKMVKKMTIIKLEIENDKEIGQP